jgi:hypothetical protein
LSENGQHLARRFHRDVVGPLVRAHRPGLPYAAGRLGSGSEVLGLDDAMSRDHDWGLRLSVLVPEEARDDVAGLLERELPESYDDWPVRFAYSGSDQARHHVDVDSLGSFVRDRLGLSPQPDAWTPDDWLGLDGQRVLEVVAGPVFHDSDGQLTRFREAIAWYPDQVWRQAVARDWSQISEEMPFVGRTGQRGDDLGSRLIAARLVDHAVHLAFLLHRTWPPYSKWRGTVLATLPGLDEVRADLAGVLAATSWQDRERRLADALEGLRDHQQAAGLPTTTRATTAFFDRPFLTVDDDTVRLLLPEHEETHPTAG